MDEVNEKNQLRLAPPSFPGIGMVSVSSSPVPVKNENFQKVLGGTKDGKRRAEGKLRLAPGVHGFQTRPGAHHVLPDTQMGLGTKNRLQLAAGSEQEEDSSASARNSYQGSSSVQGSSTSSVGRFRRTLGLEEEHHDVAISNLHPKVPGENNDRDWAVQERQNNLHDSVLTTMTRPGATAVGMSEETLTQEYDDYLSHTIRDSRDAGTTMMVSAETVDQDRILQEAHDTILANAARAEILPGSYRSKQGIKKRSLFYIIVATVFSIALGLSIGFATSRARKNAEKENFATSGGSKQSAPFGQVLEAAVELAQPDLLEYLSASRYTFPTTDGTSPKTVSSGLMATYTCRPVDCIGEHDCIVGKQYEPGCCLDDLVSNCTDDNRCGETCPDPWPCRPTRDDCRSSACIECDKGPNGEELYQTVEFSMSIDCLATGRKYLEETDEEYLWFIACGPVETGASEETNFGIGEYACSAMRQGEGFNTTMPSSYLVPCQFIQLNECGCAPADVHSFGIEPPNPDIGWTPCLTEDDCPFLCSDSGKENVRNLCNSFGGIEWWEGDNAFGQSLFTFSGPYDDDQLKIDILQEDNDDGNSEAEDNTASTSGARNTKAPIFIFAVVWVSLLGIYCTERQDHPMIAT